MTYPERMASIAQWNQAVEQKMKAQYVGEFGPGTLWIREDGLVGISRLGEHLLFLDKDQALKLRDLLVSIFPNQ